LSGYVTDPERIKRLLKYYPTLRALMKNLQVEQRTVYALGADKFGGCEEDWLLAAAIGNRALSTMPFAPSPPPPGDRMTHVVDSYKRIRDKQYIDTLTEISKEIIIIADVVEQIEQTLSSLARREYKVVTLKYFEGCTWEEVAADRDLNISSSQAKTLHGSALDKCKKQLRIKAESYEFCMRKVGGKE
jgi:hypothetical protein